MGSALAGTPFDAAVEVIPERVRIFAAWETRSDANHGDVRFRDIDGLLFYNE